MWIQRSSAFGAFCPEIDSRATTGFQTELDASCAGRVFPSATSYVECCFRLYNVTTVPNQNFLVSFWNASLLTIKGGIAVNRWNQGIPIEAVVFYLSEIQGIPSNAVRGTQEVKVLCPELVWVSTHQPLQRRSRCKTR